MTCSWCERGRGNLACRVDARLLDLVTTATTERRLPLHGSPASLLVGAHFRMLTFLSMYPTPS